MNARWTAVRTGWERFWFTPQSTAPVELFRVAFGLVATMWTLSLIPIVQPFFGRGAAIPADPDLPFGGWTVFALVGGSPWIWALWAVSLLAALAVMIGYRTRVAALVVFVMIVSVTRQAPSAFNAGDGLLRVLSFYLVLMPAGRAASLDRWISDRKGLWDFPVHAPWALRLVQVQVSVIYLSTVWEKSGGATWRTGTAVSYALRIGDLVRVPTPGFLTDSPAVMQIVTLGTLGLEASIGILVWNRAARPYVLWLGVLLHLSIDVSLAVGFFSYAMLVAYLAFVPGDRAAAVLRGADRSAPARRGSTPEAPRTTIPETP